MVIFELRLELALFPSSSPYHYLPHDKFICLIFANFDADNSSLMQIF